MGGKTMLLLIIYAGLLALAFFIANSESTKADRAQRSANDALTHASALDSSLEALRKEFNDQKKADDDAYKKLLNTLLQHDTIGEKLKNEVEWLKLRVSVPPKVAPLTIHQDQPLKIQLIYREAKAKPKAATPVHSPDPVREKVIKDIKKKMEGLNQ
jgi:hypothetical protein